MLYETHQDHQLDFSDSTAYEPEPPRLRCGPTQDGLIKSISEAITGASRYHVQIKKNLHHKAEYCPCRKMTGDEYERCKCES